MSYLRFFSSVLLCLSLLTFQTAESALAASGTKEKPIASSVLDKDWQKALSLMKDASDPVTKKLTLWIYATETNLPIAPQELMDFVRANGDWPRLHRFHEKIEESIAASARPHEIAEWFDRNPPQGYDGMKAYMQALLSLGYADRARAALSGFWQTAVLTKNETASLAGGYSRYFSATDHFGRLDRLIWEGRMEEADTMLAFVGADTRALGQARIALAQMAKNAETLLQKVPAHLQKDPGLLYERLRWRRRRNMDGGALQILDMMPQNPERADLWWKETNILARRAIENRDYAKAYAIAGKNRTTEGADYAQAEWLQGWLALRFLHKPEAAYRHFDAMYRKVQSAISRSRGAFWAARAAEALPDAVLARQWEAVAAAYPSTFYGQLSFRKIHGTGSVPDVADPPVTPETQASFAQKETVRAVRALQRAGLIRFSDPFLAKLLEQARTRQDYLLVAALAKDLGRTHYAVESNKDIQQDLGLYIFSDGYPLLPPLPSRETEPALVHAIVYRESMFNQAAQSPAGARGLMQLMPSTAQALSRQKGKSYSADKLTADPQYNILLGSAYLAQMIRRFDGFYPMAIAAYNAGPGRVDEWIEQFGDPRTGNIDILDWIELIPIYETRNYVQRVMESYFMYALRLDEKPKTVFDFIAR